MSGGTGCWLRHFAGLRVYRPEKNAFTMLIAKVATGSTKAEVEARAAFDLIFAGSGSARPISAGS